MRYVARCYHADLMGRFSVGYPFEIQVRHALYDES